MQLNLSKLFEPMTALVNDHGEHIKSKQFPSVIYMMQQDVLHRYHHAITHYLDKTLNEEYLQNSSHGTPYQKWLFFNNLNFEALDERIRLLNFYCYQITEQLTFTISRERKSRDYIPIRKTSGEFHSIHLDYENKGIFIGLKILEDEQIEINEIVQTDFHKASITKSFLNISDRSAIKPLQNKLLKEFTILQKLHKEFELVCKKYYQNNPVIEPFLFD